MKYIAVFVINLYQIFLSHIIKNIMGGSGCRFSITCSEYSKTVILEHGLFKGFYLSLVRLSKCQPLNKIYA